MTPADLMALWNMETALPIPRCRELSPERSRKCKARLAERGDDEWLAVVQRIQASAFCRGENDRGWTASFDWIIRSAEPAIRVLEGKYDNRVRPAVMSKRVQSAIDSSAEFLASFDHDTTGQRSLQPRVQPAGRRLTGTDE